MSQAVLSTLLGVGLTGAFGAIAWLVRTVIANAGTLSDLKNNLDKEDSELKLWATREFVARSDYVPAIAGIGRKLDSMADQLARIDERLEARLAKT